MREKWIILRKGADFKKIAAEFHINPVLARLIRNRNVIGTDNIEAYLNGTLDLLHDGMLMKDMDRATEILAEKIREGSKIRIIGDYDIDGVNATYILMQGIGGLGGNVDSDIPDRMKDGYGLNQELINRAIDCDIDTIVTCDNGIAALKEIEYAKRMGITVVVTDHHEVPFEEEEGMRRYIIPCADAVVDPKRQDCDYPFKGICGAGVAFKLVEALYNMFGKDVEDIDYLMENVAIATIGDVMDLVDENRIFVKQGLEMLKRTNNLGLKALMECTKIPVERLSAYHIGFIMGPCINAGGRLDTAKRALDLLCAATPKEADLLAGDLKALNDSRKDMTLAGVKAAVEQIESTQLKTQKIIVVYLPECHESLAGIIAGRIRETYQKPCFVLTKAENCVKGSGRSIEAYDMFVELTKCKQLLVKFGGHKMAAGLSLEEQQVEPFRKLINEVTTLVEEDFIPKVSIDMQLPLGYLNEELITELEVLEPYGKGNQKPIFVEKDLKIISTKILGKNQNVLKLQIKDAHGTVMAGVYFGDINEFLNYTKQKDTFAFTYYPGINEYMGQKSLQIVVQNYQ
ncbi:MAG: single-stranded-DNA-specific exonuclease RecJ [Lachnospiraceae bacterium]|nr:single-stranded-DNA-specific exonuclease RecJ [Lachnospiraceae bacterium]